MFYNLFDLIIRYYQVIETKDYQPVVSHSLDGLVEQSSFASNSSSTSFASTSSGYLSSSVADRNNYYAFFVMAQIGGFYSFLKLVFKAVLWLFTEKLFLIELLNKLRKNLNKIKEKYKVKRSKIKDQRSKIKACSKKEAKYAQLYEQLKVSLLNRITKPKEN